MADGKESLPKDNGRANLRREVAFFLVVVGVYVVPALRWFAEPGLAWDEALYIPYSEAFRQWFAGLPGTLNWADFYNTLGHFQSHPPLAKYVFSIFSALFGGSLGPLYACRLASIATTAALVGAVYLFTLRLRGRFEAIAAALLLILMPRFFANGMLAVLDVPAAFWWFVAAALFYLAMENRRLAWLAGLACALAFSTKINALMLPVVLWPWGIFFYRKKALPAILWSLVFVPVVFFAIWPFLWGAPIVNTGKYFAEKFPFVLEIYQRFGVDLASHGDAAHRMLVRSDVPVLYFGRVYTQGAPWHYAVVMIAVTTPVGILAAAAAGCAAVSRQVRHRKYLVFLVLNVVFWPLALALGAGKPYDGVRLFLSVFPFIAILGGAGVRWAWGAVVGRGLPSWVADIVVSLFLLWQAVGLSAYGALGLSYYSEVVGGVRGAAKSGFDVTFWGEVADNELLSVINDSAPDASRVAAFPMGALYVNNMRAFALLRGDLQPVDEWDDWDYMIVANRGAYLAGREDIKAMVAEPLAEKRLRGEPVAWVVRKRR